MFFEACLKSCEEFKAKVAEKTESDRFDDLTEKLTRGEGGDISIVADILSEEILSATYPLSARFTRRRADV